MPEHHKPKPEVVMAMRSKRKDFVTIDEESWKK
jgi:hypothetical protein